jgi:cell division protein FtsB
MKRNRKRESLPLGIVARAVVGCVCLGLIGLGYVWQKNQIHRLGDEIKRREAALVALQKRNSALDNQLARLKSPALLEWRCQQYQLGLVTPQDRQVVRLAEPGPEWDNAPARREPATQSEVIARR